jgi:hypothetical protein
MCYITVSHKMERLNIFLNSTKLTRFKGSKMFLTTNDLAFPVIHLDFKAGFERKLKNAVLVCTHL